MPTTVIVYDDRIREFARSPEVHDFLKDRAEEAADALRANAPVRTGAGRASVRVHMEMGPEGWYATASWDEAHYYMGIQNTRQHWADRAAATVRYV